MASPVLSVVMPSLNQRAFIGEAVRSVMAQAIDGLELVVQDGGSLDGSLNELAALSAEFAGRLRWSSAPDSGPAAAIHQAVLAARAPVIGWLNSDDVYTPGAARRALDHLARHADHVMVYGHGEHVDVHGAVIGRYPSLPPATALAAFADGCFVCQPTAFFRRDTYLATGGLDQGLQTAFDFDLWLRLFKAHPAGIGFIDAVQAHSRLHEGGITLRMRERVAMEGLAVIRRHLGPAPGHWLMTHLEELFAQHPFHDETKDLHDEFERLVQQALPFVGTATADALRLRARADRRLQLATPQLYVASHADGWAAPVLDIRLRQPSRPVQRIVLACEHASPRGDALSIEVVSPDGRLDALRVGGNGPFEIELAVADGRPQAQAVYRILSQGAFVPAEQEAGSTDRRPLAFRVLGCRLLPQAS